MVILDATEGEERFALSTQDTTTHIAASGATVVRYVLTLEHVLYLLTMWSMALWQSGEA